MEVTQAAPKAVVMEAFLKAQLAGDQRAALAVVGEALDAETPPDQMFDLVREAQIEIGRLWEARRISVAHEHVATAISQLALAAIFSRAPLSPRRGARVVVACVVGEHHDLPARLVADYLELDGFDVTYLGGDVPVEDCVRLTLERRPDVVALSVTMAYNLDALRRLVARLRAERPDLPLLLGGSAVAQAPGLLDELGVAAVGQAPAEIIAAARKLAP